MNVNRRLAAQSRTSDSLTTAPRARRAAVTNSTVKVSQRRNSINSDKLKAPTTKK